MLSDEEKKAIKKIRSFNQYNWELNNLKTKEFAKPYFDSLDTILKLIEKQSKEIEEYKKQLDLDYVDKHFVPIERYNQLKKEIEELKDKCKELIFEKQELTSALLDSTPDDKIKAKIEIRKEEKENCKDSIEEKYILREIYVLQSLLEKE